MARFWDFPCSFTKPSALGSSQYPTGLAGAATQPCVTRPLLEQTSQAVGMMQEVRRAYALACRARVCAFGFAAKGLRSYIMHAYIIHSSSVVLLQTT